MESDRYARGAFTIPGEAGHEELTLRLAGLWGADTVRDSEGTQLSDRILESGYNIYSTLCLVRADNAWAKAHPRTLQQCYLMSFPVVTSGGGDLRIDLLDGFFREQFRVNLDDDPHEWWQAHDRTSGELLPREGWSVDAEGGVRIHGSTAWHRYTVNFLAYRIWEEISMYNHMTNGWGEREHLMPVDPMHPEARAHMLDYLDRWLREHPHTSVVRFTSMLYNFFWPWADGKSRRFVLNDWGSYEFSVSPAAIRAFETAKGYRPLAEDFVNGGRYCSSHAVPTPVYRDWMDFIQGFVAEFSRECVRRVKASGKKAYVFYNDHWIGLEPTLPRFATIGFDGIIDGIFNGFEARKVAETEGVEVRELRLHPYFFPTGVNGAPSFLPGGNPTEECRSYWRDIRRALLRMPVDRIGFGGYLHLVEKHPRFIEFVRDMAREFRRLRELHSEGPPWQAPVTLAFLTAWGQQRAWGCCGHFNRGNHYNEAMESISGLPLGVRFISFEDVLEQGIPEDVDVLLNAGLRDESWCGGGYWRQAAVIEAVSAWIAEGGGLLGIGEPSSAPGGACSFQLAHIFGIDRTLPVTRAQVAPAFEVEHSHFITADLPIGHSMGREIDGIRLLDPSARVLAAVGQSPRICANTFGKGRAVYLAGHHFDPHNVRLLHRALLWAARQESAMDRWTTSNPATECAWYPGARTLVIVNNTDGLQETNVISDAGETLHARLEPGACFIRTPGEA